jgi:flagellar biosynthesis chaperone FliJ
MPAKQTRDSIEAELNASERERAARQLGEVIRHCDEFETTLRQLEDEQGLPSFYRSKPLVERMAAVGMSQGAIDHVQTYLDAIETVKSGRQDELPEHVKRELAADADAELLGAELLAGVVQSQRKA